MAQVKTPRFYISYGDWLRSMGDNIPRYHTISPYETEDVTFKTGDLWYKYPSGGYPSSSSSVAGLNWFGVLNHNVSSGYDFLFKQMEIGNSSNNEHVHNDPYIDDINMSNNQYSGFSLATFTPFTDLNVDVVIYAGVGEDGFTGTITSPEDFNIGCWVYGSTYDMSHAADLNLTLTRDFSGVKTIETKSGASLSNDFGSSPPKWGDRSAWQLGDQDFSTGGRRIWSLSFSFLSDSSVFPDNPTEIEDGGGWEVDETTPDFISEVLKKTRGSLLPFIFSPDKDSSNPEFAICKFDQSSFSFQQTAPNLYSVKMKIREVW